jgi:hypothetical protein
MSYNRKQQDKHKSSAKYVTQRQKPVSQKGRDKKINVRTIDWEPQDV